MIRLVVLLFVFAVNNVLGYSVNETTLNWLDKTMSNQTNNREYADANVEEKFKNDRQFMEGSNDTMKEEAIVQDGESNIRHNLLSEVMESVNELKVKVRNLERKNDVLERKLNKTEQKMTIMFTQTMENVLQEAAMLQSSCKCVGPQQNESFGEPSESKQSVILKRSHPSLLVLDRRDGTLYEVNLRNKNSSVLYRTSERVRAVVFNSPSRDIIMSNENGIYSRRIDDDAGPREIIRDDSIDFALALDSTRKTLFFSRMGRLMKVSLHEKQVEQVLDTGDVYQIYSLALHQQNGTIFWARSDRIGKCSYNGKDETMLVTGEKYLGGITIDEKSNILFYSNFDAIESYSLNSHKVYRLTKFSALVTHLMYYQSTLFIGIHSSPIARFDLRTNTTSVLSKDTYTEAHFCLMF